jgi:hypothetical protein
MNPLIRAFAEQLDQQQKKTAKPRPLPEAQIAELMGLYRRYAAPNPLRPGDLVMTLPNSPYKLSGEPRVVLEFARPSAISGPGATRRCRTVCAPTRESASWTKTATCPWCGSKAST